MKQKLKVFGVLFFIFASFLLQTQEKVFASPNQENFPKKFFLKNIGIVGTYPQLNTFDSSTSSNSTSGITTQQQTILAPFVLQTDEVVNYTADLMPQDSTPFWYERNEGGTAYITNGLLYLSTYIDYGAARAYYRYWNANNTTGWTVEAKLKVMGTYHRIWSDAPYQGLVIEMFDNSKNVALEFYANKIVLFNWATNRTPPPPSIATYNLDTTTFHTYRITGEGNNVYVYVDNNLVIDGTSKLTQATFGQRICFGDDNNGPESGTAYWDYVYYDTTGAYAPGKTPPTTDIIQNINASTNVIAPYKDIIGIQPDVLISYELLERVLINVEVQQNGTILKKLFPTDIIQNKGANSVVWAGTIDAEEISNTKLELLSGRNDSSKIVAKEGDYTLIIKAYDLSTKGLLDSAEVPIKVMAK
ncbi:MAG: hypothetical protein M1365_05750 [Actinobacteria bacterium]|nr:hypothetical protein [Actinomycetota bacterium]